MRALVAAVFAIPYHWDIASLEQAHTISSRLRIGKGSTQPALQFLAGFVSTFTALRHCDFCWLWAGTFFTTGAQWIQQATLSWVVYVLTGSGALLGAVLCERAIPTLLLAPVTGIVAVCLLFDLIRTCFYVA